MLTYRVSYRRQEGMFVGQISEFPEATSLGYNIEQVRSNVTGQLRFQAERLLRRGDLLPIPADDAGQAGAYLEETVTLLPEADGSVSVMVKSGG